jgi:hypothetical protein
MKNLKNDRAMNRRLLILKRIANQWCPSQTTKGPQVTKVNLKCDSSAALAISETFEGVMAEKEEELAKNC